jgi:hypothetical protein
MPLKALRLKSGIFRENTRYSAEGGWYECDKVRFRSGQPEKIGGWQQVSNDQFLGYARALWPWDVYLGLGTEVKYYVYYEQDFYDITPIRVTGAVTSFDTYNGFPYVGVVDTSTGVGTFATGELTVGTYVTYTTPGTVGGINLNTAGVDGTSEYSILSNVTLVTCSTSGTTLTVASVDSPGIIVTGATITINGTPYTLTGTGTTGAYTLSGTPSPAVPAGTQLGVVNTATYFIQASTNATSTATGGAATVSKYQPSVGAPIQNQSPGLLGSGWGLSGWGSGGWGGAGVFTYGEPTQIGLWNAYNFGEDLIYGPKGGAIYYWDASAGFPVRGINIADDPGASANTPVVANYRMVSDASRIVLVFGTNPWGTSTAADLDPMLIRWSDQEDYLNWEPSATTQAGDVTLSRGSEIRAVAQTRQEILVWTDIALYSLQYIGAPEVWRSEILADNITIVSDRAWAVAAGVTYWMGDEKFYVFDGRVQTLNCDIRKFIFDDFNASQRLQVFASTVEQFSEVWWFYCSITGPDGTGTPANPNTVVDRYAVFNYAERIWYYGSMGRTAWLDASVISNLPIAADYNRRLLNHETGCDDASTTQAAPIESYIISSEFDIDDGHNFGFVRRMLPDVTFTGSTAAVENQSLTMSLLPLQNSGSGYTRGVDSVEPNVNMSVALTNEATVQRNEDKGIERFSGTVTPYDGNLYIRVRGRQMALRVASTGLGVQWQLGTPRMDVRPSGRKS